MQPLLTIATLTGLAALPVVFSWLIVVLPSKRREAFSLRVGNPLLIAPLSNAQPVVSVPLVAMSRQLTAGAMTEYVLGMRHQPVELVAPLLARMMRCDDPALQLFAQSLLAQGQERWQTWMNRLAEAPENDARSAAWLLECGLVLASPALVSPAERAGALSSLAVLARQRLQSSQPTPLLLATAAQVFLEAGQAAEARSALHQLPQGSPLRSKWESAVAHALHLQGLAC